MNAAEKSPPAGPQTDAAALPEGARQTSTDPFTRVRLVWIEGKIEHWIRFGRISHERIVDRRTRIVGFRAGAVFACIRWASNDYGTIKSCIDVVLSVRSGAACSTIPGVSPGGEILLHASGWPRVERVLRAIDQVEHIGVDPCDVAPDHWRHLHNRLTAGVPARVYSLDRHRAWLRRKELQP